VVQGQISGVGPTVLAGVVVAQEDVAAGEAGHRARAPHLVQQLDDGRARDPPRDGADLGPIGLQGLRLAPEDEHYRPAQVAEVEGFVVLVQDQDGVHWGARSLLATFCHAALGPTAAGPAGRPPLCSGFQAHQQNPRPAPPAAYQPPVAPPRGLARRPRSAAFLARWIPSHPDAPLDILACLSDNPPPGSSRSPGRQPDSQRPYRLGVRRGWGHTSLLLAQTGPTNAAPGPPSGAYAGPRRAPGTGATPLIKGARGHYASRWVGPVGRGMQACSRRGRREERRGGPRSARSGPGPGRFLAHDSGGGLSPTEDW